MLDEPSEKLSRIFERINHSDLPALSAAVREIISLVDSRRATAEALARIILKDFALTNKIFQLVNSPYYCRTVPISSVSRAVTILGFSSVRDIAIGIGLFEDFLKAGLEKDAVVILLVQSFVGAELARSICFEKRLQLSAEEGFICTLLHNLGRIVILIYLPDLYRTIEKRTAGGEKEKEVVPTVLAGLSFHQVGQEIARFWNFSEEIVATMISRPRKPKMRSDRRAVLQVLVVFCNRMTKAIGSGEDLSVMIANYGKILGITNVEAIELLLQSVERVGAMNPTVRSGLNKLKLRSRLMYMKEEAGAKRGV